MQLTVSITNWLYDSTPLAVIPSEIEYHIHYDNVF